MRFGVSNPTDGFAKVRTFERELPWLPLLSATRRLAGAGKSEIRTMLRHFSGTNLTLESVNRSRVRIGRMVLPSIVEPPEDLTIHRAARTMANIRHMNQVLTMKV